MTKANIGVAAAAMLIALFVVIRLREAAVNKGDENAVYTVAIRYALTEGFPRSSFTTKRMVFIRMDGKDPTSRFISELQLSTVDVRPGSRAKGVAKLNSGDFAKDMHTGEEGEYLNFSAIKWNDPIPQTYDPVTGEASVGVEHFGPPLTSADYELSRKNGNWVVIDRAYAIAQ
jgi:hypothetical protein